MNRVLIRVIGAPLILAGFALCVYADHVRNTTTAMTVLIGCFAAASFHELCAMGRLKGLRPAEWLGLLGIIASWAYFIGIFKFNGAEFAVFALGPLFLITVLLLLVFRSKSFAPPDAGYTVLAATYVSLLLFIPIAIPQWKPSWNYWLLFLVATNKGSDMAAYIVGKAIGRHRMAPTISPNKTWEGAFAGLAAGTFLGYLVLRRWPDLSWEFFEPSHHVEFMVATAALVTVAAQLGDLVKSAIKRWAGVKDSGRFLPEFGGALDMVDSFIVSAPVAFLLILFFADI